MKNKRVFLKNNKLKEAKKEAFFTPARVRKVGNKTHIDLTKPGAYLPAEMYHPEDDLYED